MPFKSDQELEVICSANKCLEEFLSKGGTFQSIPDLLTVTTPQIELNPGDAVYPVCSGGWCRSQTLWMVLEPYSKQIILFPPHAARVGWDPFNGQINRHRNYEAELALDAFKDHFGKEKALRFGFENDVEWKAIEKSPTQVGLKAISQYYDEHYFGPNSSWEGNQGKRRIYITFSKNTHVILYRLNQTHESFDNVTVIAVESEDIITDPPDHLNTSARSVKAYGYFAELLNKVLIFQPCNNDIKNKNYF